MVSCFKLINVSTANLYKAPTFRSEQTHQGLLGERVEVLESASGFSRVKMEDGYKAWINKLQLCNDREMPPANIRIRSHIARVFCQPDVTSQIIRDVTIGRSLFCREEQGKWLEIELPDGASGWLEKRHIGSFPELTRNNLITIAEEFTGYPYFWGGRTPKGMDCSGYVQLVYSLFGIDLPRDAWMQHKEAQIISTDFCDAQPGDLYFFSRDGNYIDHVAFALGEGEVIHARGMIGKDSLNQDHENFCPILHRNFIGVGTFYPQ